jgi:hypothetical protein
MGVSFGYLVIDFQYIYNKGDSPDEKGTSRLEVVSKPSIGFLSKAEHSVQPQEYI